MALLRLNIGARLNIFKSSLTNLFRSSNSASAQVSNARVIYRPHASSNSTCEAIAVTRYVAKSTVTIECTATATTTSTYVRYTVVPDSIACGATVTATAHAISGSLGTATVTATSHVRCHVRGSSISAAISQAKVTKANEIIIAAYNSSPKDKLIADYICTGVSDQKLINDIASGIKVSGLTLLFCRGLFKCDDSINLKNVNFIGSGANKTIFEFSKPNNKIIARTTGTTTIDSFSIRGSGSLHVIYDDALVGTRTNKFVISNITGSNFNNANNQYYNNASPAKIMVEMAYPTSPTELTARPEVYLEMHNCDVSDTDSSGFMIFGELINDVFRRTFKDIYIYNCHANRCGMKDRGSVVAGFHLLTNVSTKDIRIINSSANDNWHSGFYFDDARVRTFVAYKKLVKESNTVNNLYMDNCTAHSNGMRSKYTTPAEFEPYCSGFVLREFGKGSDLTGSVADFITWVDYQKVVTVPTYPAYTGDARGSYQASVSTRFAYGNLTNCIATNNRYAGFYFKGYKWNAAELTLRGCVSSHCTYAYVLDNHDGVRFMNCTSNHSVNYPIMLKNIDTITLSYMRIDGEREATTLSFVNRSEYDMLPIGKSKFVEVIS